MTTQTRLEPKIDKGKVRMLLQSLWECVEPEPEQSSNISMLPEFGYRRVPPPSPQTKLQSNQRRVFPSSSETIRETNSHQVKAKSTHTKVKPCPRVQDSCNPQASSHHLKQEEKLKRSKQSPKKNKLDESSPSKGSHNVSVNEIMELFKPMPPCISPLSELDTSVESVKMDGEEKKDHPEPSEDVPIDEQVQPSNIKRATCMLVICPKSLF
ncbi:hypothetical protein GOODEAATRI_022420 [Goodea atripinnis]|uniref:Uncharacterized protein n=1 Tax=Goodea atripinnis TaxID=208336 RepID=A0ABV0Q0T9_9TELE